MTLTMSALPRALNCTSSLVLPRAENHSEWADAGNDEHEELSHLDDPDLAHLIPSGARAEVKVAYDVSTGVGRIIGDGAGRDYGTLGPFEIPGSIDVLGVEGETVVIRDWKTGYADVDPAVRNWQLYGYALAATRALGKSRARVGIVYTKQGNRLDEAEIDAFDLAEFAGRLEALHMRVPALRDAYRAGEPLDTREGAWCKWCPSKHVCPSKNALLVQVSQQGLAVLGDSAMTPERARTGYEQIVKVEQLVKEARKRLETYIDENGPIDLGNGRMFGRYVRNGNERLNGDVAVRAIATVVGESAKEFESIAIERRTTKAAIERAAKQLGCKRGTVPAVVKKIRELGGAARAPDSMPLGEYARGEVDEAPALDINAVNRALESA